MTVLALCLLLESTAATHKSSIRPRVFSRDPAIAPMYYSRVYLLSLQHCSDTSPLSLEFDCSSAANRTNNKPKRGSRQGVRNRLKKSCFRPTLPSMTLSNVRSIQNKMDELSTLIVHDCDYCRNSLLCFTTIQFDSAKKKTEKVLEVDCSC